ncbi:MAG: decarboxylating 6-phosphogluconate dehydrogenase [Rhodothermales bacterium]
MDIGMVGLGKMGGSMSLRLVRKRHRVVAFDLSDETVAKYEEKGVDGATSIEHLVEQLDAPRRIWMMVPAGDAVDATIDSLRPLLDEGDVLIDGGNSDYRNTMRRGRELAGRGIHLVDAGTSGGVWGLEEGYCLMVGGPEGVVDGLRPVLDDLASDGAAGWDRVGPTGSGHFVKMVHNGIEYGVMQAYAEGFAVLEAKKEFDVDLHAVSELWRHGSVIRSWLLDLTTNLFDEDPDLDDIAPFVPDSGEGRWTVREAIDLNVAAPVITTSLLQRIASRDERSFAHRVLSGMRNQFGGHAVKRTDD